MGKYTGCQCIICQKVFENDDDIVVCPDCGTPYHRSCYQSAGHCINQPLHAVGGSWQSIQDEHRRKLGGIECPHCGYVNLPDAVNFCKYLPILKMQAIWKFSAQPGKICR